MPRYLVTVVHRHAPDAPQQLYLLDGELAAAAVQRLTDALLHDPVVQTAAWCALSELPDAAPGLEIAYKPGVTDNEAESVRGGAALLGLPLRAARTLRRYAASDTSALVNPLVQTGLHDPAAAARLRFYTELLDPPAAVQSQVAHVPLLQADDRQLLEISRAGILALDLAEMQAIQRYFQTEEREPTDGELETVAQTWSEHCSHKTFKAKVRYQATPVASPGAAQPSRTGDPVWSPNPGSPNPGSPNPGSPNPGSPNPALTLLESAPEVALDSLIKTFLMAATDAVLAKHAATERAAPDLSLPPSPWVLSAFVDNAGIIAFGPDHELSFKVETHNHPSALEPFGGANTGVGGVVRDVLGVSAQPIANTNVLCFGPLDLPPDALTDGVLHPTVIAAGVVAGVRDYGNKLGIATVNGAVLYDPGYTANPLVFAGTVGLAPRDRHPRNVQPGDVAVVLGGRTGRDGIHGATFSSVELTHTTAADVGSAVQIGDPITEKKLIDVIVQARDLGLYSAITDCGAGGLSSAIGEMGERTGVTVQLADAPLKYAGLQPWEIWLSEAQERMVLAVPPQHLDALLALCASEDVEATALGTFTGDGRLTVRYHDLTVVDLTMQFLHDGRPQRVLEAVWNDRPPTTDHRPSTTDHRPPPTDNQPSPVVGGQWSASAASAGPWLAVLLRLLGHPNIASKAPIVRTYDHEVGGRTVVKPLVGVQMDGPGDAAVLQPLPGNLAGVALGCGINPRYGVLDPYWMALAVVDEALRNVTAVGGNPQQAAILDNFCWGDPRQPDRMAGLVRAAAGCYDAALAYGTPFISGKDSLNNEYRASDGSRTPIPPTLLISALAEVPDVTQTVTMDLKTPGNALFLVGVTRAELGGAHLWDVWQPGSTPESPVAPAPQAHAPLPPSGAAASAPERAPASDAPVPRVDLTTAPKLLAALHAAIRAGTVRACHDLSEGGLAVAAAEMVIAGQLGLTLDLSAVPREGAADAATLLFSESATRLLVEVPPEKADAFAAHFGGLPCARVGAVEPQWALTVSGLDGAPLLAADGVALRDAWQATKVV